MTHLASSAAPTHAATLRKPKYDSDRGITRAPSYYQIPSNLQTALDLCRKGYYIHPLAANDKKPLAPHGSNDATRDEETIRAWWTRWPAANVGIGLDKTGLVDIAPDSPEWAERFRAYGMPATMLYSSGGGNGHWHALYRLPSGGPVARDCVPAQYDIMSQGNAVAPGSIHPSGRAYTLRTKLLAVEGLPLAPAWAVEQLQAHIKAVRVAHNTDDWQNLPCGALLAHSRRFQALCKANDQLRTVVSGGAVTLTVKGGGQDNSPSIQRSVFVNQLLRAKYPHNEIRALALHFSGVLESKPKGFQSDIDNLLRPVDQGGYTPKDYKPDSTGVIAQSIRAPRGGRHYEITAAELFDRYNEYADCGPRGIVLEWSVNEAAERIGVSTGTIKRREAELTAAGQIRREYGRVILSLTTWEIRSQRIETPQVAEEAEVPVLLSTETPDENTIGSQFATAHQDAPNVPEMLVRIERAHAEITHSPGYPPMPDRDLLTRVRELARLVCEPGWYLCDYDAMSNAELRAELARLRSADEWAAAEADADVLLAEWERDPRWHRVDPVIWSRTQTVLRGPDVAQQWTLDFGPPGQGEVCSFSARRALYIPMRE